MKNSYIALITLLFFNGVMGQVLTNYYLEPGSTNDEAILHTSFYASHGAGYIDHIVEITGNVIDFSICYQLSSTQVETFDVQEFLIDLPINFPDIILNVNLYFWDQNLNMCDYANVMDGGTITFDFPYLPTAKTNVSDDNFEGYLELIELGDDIANNDLVFTHRLENLEQLIIDGNTLGTLGLGEIEDLTGIEILLNLERLRFQDNLISEFDASNHPALWKLLASNNPILNLDFSLNPALRILILNENNLETLNVRNGNNANFDDLTIANNPGLRCITVDDPLLAPYPNWFINLPGVIYSEDCSLVGIDDLERPKHLLYPNPVNSVLSIQGQEPIHGFQLYDISGKLVLASEEMVNQIDFSGFEDGIYFLNFTTDSGTVIEKILKE